MNEKWKKKLQKRIHVEENNTNKKKKKQKQKKSRSFVETEAKNRSEKPRQTNYNWIFRRFSVLSISSE